MRLLFPENDVGIKLSREEYLDRGLAVIWILRYKSTI